MFVLVPTGDLSSQSSDTLMSLRTTPIPQVVSAGSAGVRYPAGSLGCVVVQYVRPVPSELGWGRLSRFSLLRGSLHPHAMSRRVSECNPSESRT